MEERKRKKKEEMEKRKRKKKEEMEERKRKKANMTAEEKRQARKEAEERKRKRKEDMDNFWREYNRNGGFGGFGGYQQQQQQPFPDIPKKDEKDEKDKKEEKELEKMYQEELINKKDLINSDKFRCVNPYNRREYTAKQRVTSCKQEGNFSKGYPEFFNQLQQCTEYCQHE